MAADRAYIYVGLYSGRRFYVGVGHHLESIARSIARRCPAGASVTDRQLYDVGPWYDGSERTIAHHWACEQYLADRLSRRGWAPVRTCRACERRGVRRACGLSGCLAHCAARGHWWESTLRLARALYPTISVADFTPVEWPTAYAASSPLPSREQQP
jgi:hypothetical protein